MPRRLRVSDEVAPLLVQPQDRLRLYSRDGAVEPPEIKDVHVLTARHLIGYDAGILSESDNHDSLSSQLDRPSLKSDVRLLGVLAQGE